MHSAPQPDMLLEGFVCICQHQLHGRPHIVQAYLLRSLKHTFCEASWQLVLQRTAGQRKSVWLYGSLQLVACR